jgi:hypothetical protein
MAKGVTICESAANEVANTKMTANNNLEKDGECSFFFSCIGLFGELIA